MTLDVRPGLSVNNGPNSALRDSVLARQLVRAHDAWPVPLSDFEHLRLGQLRSVVRLSTGDSLWMCACSSPIASRAPFGMNTKVMVVALQRSASFNHLARVFLGSALSQVARVIARRIVTGVLHLKLWINRAIRDLESDTMRSRSVVMGNVEIAVSIPVSTAEPQPAVIWSANIDLRPEPLGSVGDLRHIGARPRAVLVSLCTGWLAKIRRATMSARLWDKLAGHLRTPILGAMPPDVTTVAGVFLCPYFSRFDARLTV